MIALKSVDLSKAPSYVLEEMQKEVEIYKDLVDIQGNYIPKLVCYGYYGGGMSFVIGMTIVGTSLSEQKIKKRQKTRAIRGLEAIHKHGILHNDIQEENILINDNVNPASPITQDKESRSHKKKEAENIVQDVFDFTMDGSEKKHMTEISLTGREENNCQEKIESQGGLAELSSSDVLQNINRLYENACTAENERVKANQAEILC
ncbi:9404_t:CDS:2 [Funneliformis geosporum]|uniref:9404_t:CDS:1 n=1 Tax=Funneliformis geosporum TaxID=1117311 RepID=A0A9W4SG03_9GLOM|nr:9404_t:CDS:2 [Funneliformis geosporum]